MARTDRRGFLVGGIELVSALAVGCGGRETDDEGGMAPDPAGEPLCGATRADIEGPFFTPESPERGDLIEPGMEGAELHLRGRVIDADCQPVTHAVVDLWQADAEGVYDEVGFRLRGHVRVDEEGRYDLSTIVPGRYLNGGEYRPAHLHVKVYVGGQERLTTQLYFEGDPYNEIDPWFSAETMLRPVDSDGKLEAVFDFVV